MSESEIRIIVVAVVVVLIVGSVAYRMGQGSIRKFMSLTLSEEESVRMEAWGSLFLVGYTSAPSRNHKMLVLVEALKEACSRLAKTGDSIDYDYTPPEGSLEFYEGLKHVRASLTGNEVGDESLISMALESCQIDGGRVRDELLVRCHVSVLLSKRTAGFSRSQWRELDRLYTLMMSNRGRNHEFIGDVVALLEAERSRINQPEEATHNAT